MSVAVAIARWALTAALIVLLIYAVVTAGIGYIPHGLLWLPVVLGIGALCAGLEAA